MAQDGRAHVGEERAFQRAISLRPRSERADHVRRVPAADGEVDAEGAVPGGEGVGLTKGAANMVGM